MRLPSRLCWPIPVTLDVNEAFAAAGLQPGDTIALRDAEGLPGRYHGSRWDVAARKRRGGPNRLLHRQRRLSRLYLLHRTNSVYVSGRVVALEPIPHYDQSALRQSPAALRECFRKFGWQRDVAFQTRNPLHRATNDIDCFTRVRYDQRILGRFTRVTAPLSLFNLAMRMAGSRARPSGTRSFAGTTAARTSSSSATMPHPALMETVVDSTRPMTRRR